MPNAIKYNVSAETLALKKGNFWIGTGDVGKGPTSSTGYYNGITPPSGGYTIYLNKETGGPSIYVASNDSQLISLTNTIANQSYTTANECLVYFAGQTDKLCVNRDLDSIITSGLTFYIDGSIVSSLPKSGSTVYDMCSFKSNDFTLINGAQYDSTNGGTMYLDGTDDYIISTKNSGILGNSPRTIIGWYNIEGITLISNSGWGNLFTTGNNDCSNLMFGLARQNGTLLTWGGCYDASTGLQLPLNTWLFIAASYDGTNYDAYVNTNTVRLSRPSYNTAESKIFIGAETVNNGVDFRSLMKGHIGSFYQYNRALSSSEITHMYNFTKGRFGL
jgi:hypothetical protein